MENKPMEIYDFANLMLAYLAKKPRIVDIKKSNIKGACLPMNYKQIIECILTAKNGWKESFSALIDTEEYFDEHFAWEVKLSRAIMQVVKDLEKEIKYDLCADLLIIYYSDEEIATIMKMYDNEELNKTMDHFTNLLQSYIYSRGFQERFDDYFAEAVKTMKQIENRDEKTTIDEILKPKNEKQEEKRRFVKRLGAIFKQ